VVVTDRDALARAGQQRCRAPAWRWWLAGALAPLMFLAAGTSTDASYTGTVSNGASSLVTESLTGVHAPAGGSVVTATDSLAGGCTTTWTGLSGGTAVASTYRLVDLVGGATLSEPGNVDAGSYASTPTQTVSRHQLTTRSGTAWTSDTANSVSVACVLSNTRAIAVGRWSACAIRANDSLWCWGLNDWGQLGLGDDVTRSAPAQVGASTWRNASVSHDFACGVRTDGTLWCWGHNDHGQLGLGDTTDRTTPAQVGAVTSWRQVSVGNDFACATRTGGTLWCWGDNWGGQLGLGNTTPNTTPVQVGVATTWKSVDAGGWSACGVRTDGTAWCWGANSEGKVGDGSTTNRTSPTQVGIATDWRNVTVGGYHVCGARTSGALWCWGANWNGQIGDGTTTARLAPVQVGSGSSWADAAAGELHTCAGTALGTLWCWGWDGFDQAGSDAAVTDKLAPTQVGAVATYGPVAAGGQSSCAIRTDSTLWCWGHDGVGALGRAATAFATPAAVDANAWISATVGAGHACGVRSAGTMWCWGLGLDGQTGLGSIWEVAPAWYGTQVGSATNWSSVAAGAWHTCGIRNTGTLWCWGRGTDGRLGTGSTTTQTSPTQVGSATNWASVSAGTDHTCGVRTTGTLWCWGDNVDGELGLGDTTDYSTPQQVGVDTDWAAVSAGADHTCGLRAGVAYCWGTNSYRQLGTAGPGSRTSPTAVFGGGTYVSIAAGTGFSCGVLNTGTLWCWGNNSLNQLGDGTTSTRNTPEQIATGITDWTQVTTGLRSACARRTTGNDVYCWGGNRSGQLGLGTTSTSVSTPTLVATDASAGGLVASSYGEAHCARNGTTLSCWGDDRYATLGRQLTASSPAQANGGVVWRA
jgi:alpha-tubulin suppressor-like RCC1 family protein